MNRWRIPDWLEREVRQRDTECVYCRTPLLETLPADRSRKSVATWEHIINDARIVTRENIARCCAPCNSSKGTKALSVWLRSSYCRRRGIGPDTVADVVKMALASDDNREEWVRALAQAVAEHNARPRQHANFYDWPDKVTKHLGIAGDFCEYMQREFGIAYSIAAQPELDPQLPPDVVLEDSRTERVGVEITELVNKRAIAAQIQDRADYFAISYNFKPREAVELLQAIIAKKELAAVSVYRQYDDYLLLIHCAEPWLSRDELATAIEAHSWPATRGIRAAYLLFDYFPQEPRRVVRIF